MKNLYTALILSFLSISAFSQDSKFYVGASFAGSTLQNAESAQVGEHFGLGSSLGVNFGYRLNENFGFTANFLSSNNSLNENNDSDYSIGITTLSVGPMFSMPFGDKIIWDFKPQISLMTQGKESGDAVGYSVLYNIGGTEILGSPRDEWKWSGGPSWVFGNSIVFKVTDNISVSLDVDYVMARFTEVEDPAFDSAISDINDVLNELDLELRINRDFEIDYNNLRFGLGVRYNF